MPYLCQRASERNCHVSPPHGVALPWCQYLQRPELDLLVGVFLLVKINFSFDEGCRRIDERTQGGHHIKIMLEMRKIFEASRQFL
jgi:hypothetical protein